MERGIEEKFKENLIKLTDFIKLDKEKNKFIEALKEKTQRLEEIEKVNKQRIKVLEEEVIYLQNRLFKE